MQVVFILLPLALLVAGVMLALFVWAAKSGQFEDLETPPVRMLLDDEDHARAPAQVPPDSSNTRRGGAPVP